jgi:hypothetical protein
LLLGHIFPRDVDIVFLFHAAAEILGEDVFGKILLDYIVPPHLLLNGLLVVPMHFIVVLLAQNEV